MFASSFPLIVHCHLRWNFVWQRPQQFLSRLSKKHRVLFVEGPILHEEEMEPCFTLTPAPDYPHITVMETHFPASRFQDGAWVDAQRRRLVEEALRGPLKGKFDSPVQWFYDPMAVEAHLGHHNACATVYDCMDELSQFKFAPPALIEREARLLKAADVVFAGGRKMWQSKSRHNSNAHFYGCGVDVVHFGKARLSSTALPEEVRDLEGPILGYFGVVDERLDYDLIGKLAAARPDWHIVMVGPTAKVDPAEFPQAPNLHWLGGRDYSQLPAYTKAFDVALMPFALNEATEYINPTKALEYMATATPIISTPVPDVVSNFATVVKISENSNEFVELCVAQACQIDKIAVERGLKMANENTWDAIVAKLEKHIEEAIVRKMAKQKALNTSSVSTRIAASAA
jgi:glycosyltransferase involved in cell wall biosynthesis